VSKRGGSPSFFYSPSPSKERGKKKKEGLPPLLDTSD